MDITRRSSQDSFFRRNFQSLPLQKINDLDYSFLERNKFLFPFSDEPNRREPNQIKLSSMRTTEILPGLEQSQAENSSNFLSRRNISTINFKLSQASLCKNFSSKENSLQIPLYHVRAIPSTKKIFQIEEIQRTKSSHESLHEVEFSKDTTEEYSRRICESTSDTNDSKTTMRWTTVVFSSWFAGSQFLRT